MVFHVLSIPSYPTRKEITISPFVQKVYKFCKHMTQRGHSVYHYGHPDSEVQCTQHFNVVSRATYEKDYGHQTWREFNSEHVENKTHEEFNQNTVKFINQTLENENDMILAFWGFGHKKTTERIDKGHIVEPSIGYGSCFAPNRIFISYTHMHTILQKYGEKCPKWTDQVIPPSFDKDDFPLREKKDYYLIYLGRMVNSKGVVIAQKLAQILKMKIKFVGPQNMRNSLDKSCKYSEFIHTVSFEERGSLLSKAKAMLMPSLYSEPCGWTMIESMLCGTPVISTDWGGMAEYNLHGVTGFRCKSINEFYHAILLCDKIDPHAVRSYAIQNFDPEIIYKYYENYFEHLILGQSTVYDNCNFTCKPNFIVLNK